ncbi:DUF7168 domain-containing protein [Actinophytocola sp.]|uniref:DUF7168 domain-containing protein n=1 Tax=Actinophytocola sp. TaxID=1872138 RepID=UPI002D7F602A|nr:hypothetical protein [Actinophytocola sp.]HET9144047.1 hypothetical protein [Actinophytocola sp.]
MTENPTVERSTPEEIAERRRAGKLGQIEAQLAIAADERAPEGERDAALNRAMELMARHGVTEMMLAARRGQATDTIIEKKILISDPYSYEKMLLASQIASALNCRSFYSHYRNIVSSITIIGFRSDVERVELLYTSLLLQAVNAVRKERPYSYSTASETRQYRKSWLVGFGERVGVRLWRKEQEARAKYDQEHAADGDGEPGTGLVLVGRRDQVKAFYEANFGFKPRKNNRQVDAYAKRDGRRAGDKADLGGGTGVTRGDRPALPAR